jgi:hypothetical protein
VRPSSEVHVTNGASREHETSQHLGQVVRGNAVTVAGVKQGALQKMLANPPWVINATGITYERSDNDSENERDNVCPNRERDVLLGDNDYAKNEAENKYETVPPPRGLLVMLGHMVMMTIVVFTDLCAHVSTLNVTTPEKNAVGNQGTNLEDC